MYFMCVGTTRLLVIFFQIKGVIDEKKSITIRQALSLVGKITPKLTATLRGAFDYQKNKL